MHTAIGRRHLQAYAGQAEAGGPPAYVARGHGPALRADIEEAASGTLQALVVVRGGRWRSGAGRGVAANESSSW